MEGWCLNERVSDIHRSADLQSAVSPICNRRTFAKLTDSECRVALQVANLRYSRLQICATAETDEPTLYERPYQSQLDQIQRNPVSCDRAARVGASGA